MKTIDQSLMERVRCAACKGEVARTSDRLVCAACGARFPVIRGVPVLVDESKSLFRVAECVASAGEGGPPSPWRELARRALGWVAPRPGENLCGRENLRRLAEELRKEYGAPRVLILGGGSMGVGTDAVIFDPAFRVVESDVMFGPRTNLVCDAHEIPFQDGSFDAVIAQGLFEYLIDPFRVAEEIHRVLGPAGWLYVESPFMQQVHGGAYDFFRFTHVGHRSLFRRFEEVESGVACGPAMALSWSYRYLLRSFTRTVPGRALASAFADATSGWVTRFDRPLQGAAGAYDAASAFYFLGRRSETVLAGREILAAYRGLCTMRR